MNSFQPNDDRAARLRALEEAPVVLCSACLLGFHCRYDGDQRLTPAVMRALGDKAVVPICPEVAGGLSTPRPPAEISAGSGLAVAGGQSRVLTRSGEDLTAAFLRGAELAREAARRYGASVALLKEGSPSCGVNRISQNGQPTEGQGVTAAILFRAGVAVLSEEDLPSST